MAAAGRRIYPKPHEMKESALKALSSVRVSKQDDAGHGRRKRDWIQDEMLGERNEMQIGMILAMQKYLF